MNSPEDSPEESPRDGTDAGEGFSRPPPVRRSRLGAAWAVLWGEAIVPDDLRLEWLEYKATFEQLVQRWSVLLARQAKADKRRAVLLEQELPHLRPPPPLNGKARVRSLVAEARGLAKHRIQINASPEPGEPSP